MWCRQEWRGRSDGNVGLLVGNSVIKVIHMTDWTKCDAVERNEGKVSGVWVFKGTRVPVKALFENLEAGARIDDFLEWFPGVTRKQAEAVLEYASRSLAVA